MSTQPHLRLVPEPGLGPAPALDPGLEALEAEMADLREAIFSLGDLARRALPRDRSAVHVALQAAAHYLGEAERETRCAS